MLDYVTIFRNEITNKGLEKYQDEHPKIIFDYLKDQPEFENNYADYDELFKSTIVHTGLLKYESEHPQIIFNAMMEMIDDN